MQYIINNSHHAVVKATPSKLMFGFEQRSHADFPLEQYTKSLADIDTALDAERAKARDLAGTATELIRTYNKKYRDDHSKKPSVYSQGDYVMVRDLQSKPGENTKLKPKYKGPT